jgi:tetratricopeptide (TPR) repeat protein
VSGRRLAGWLRGGAALATVAIACAGQQPASPADLRSRIERLLHRGDADGAIAALRGRAADPTVALLLGEALVLRGRVAEAEAAFRRARDSSPGDRWLATARLAELALSAGRADEASRLAGQIDRSLDLEADLGARDWVGFAIASRLLGFGAPARYKDALDAYDRAIARDSTWLEPRLRVGDLFLEKYVAPEARSEYERVLRRDPENARARLGIAAVLRFSGDPAAFPAARRALDAGPGLAAAHVLLGRLELDAEQFDSAAARAHQALTLDSTHLDAWALRGAVEILAGHRTDYEATERLLRLRHPAPAGFYTAIAEALGRQRRYEEAAAFARQAVALRPDEPSALTTLGINELRLGAMDSGRVRLERAFERDPYHPWNKNTLDLLDEMAKHRITESGRFALVAPAEEADLLTLYLIPLLERAYDSLAARYRYRPETPIRLELFRREADFSVRTVGLAGLGALGVSFGRVLAMDAPSARTPRGQFNWGSTAWHELTHTFTLGATGHRVPRWLSEGLSVLEERRARPGWGAHATIPFLSAYKGGKLHPVSRLNDGFVRPAFPAQVPFSYYQASLVCEYLEETRGWDALVGMLGAYRRGLPTDSVVRTVLGMTPEALDRGFDEWFRARFGGALARVGAASDSATDAGELGTLLENAARLRAAGRADEAIAVLERVQQAFAEQGDAESAAWHLARIYQERGQRQRALDQLARVTRLNETHLEANRREAALLTEAGDTAGAMAALERAIFIEPYDAGLHLSLAQLAGGTGRHDIAIRERRAILALDPSDRAEALYQLAVAYRDAGDRAAARREVLRALEQAPSFERAQALLLELRRPP